jgi:hypothetical protein
MTGERTFYVSEPGLPHSTFSLAHPLDPGLVRDEVRGRLSRLSSMRATFGRHGFDVTDELVDRVAAFVKSGSCAECGRRDAVCVRPDPAVCRVSEVMES